VGPSIQIDPLFPYYQHRSPESVAEEIEAAGYQIVRYFVVNERQIQSELIDAFHERGMFVWALVLGNGTFSTEGYPPEWPEWRMGLLRPVHDGYERLSPFSEAYAAWKKRAIAELVSRYPFDGIEIAEPYFPEWDGIRRGVYGDVGPLAQKAFRQQYGLEIPDFTNPLSRRFYKRNRDLYQKWVQFRIDAVNRFVDELINGQGGARETRPDLAVATWSLAVDDGPGSPDRLREMQGLDAPSMIAKVKPDLHVLQTHWPDWTKSRLPADYIRNYEPFVREIRKSHPDLPLAVQADIGSARNMVKNGEWVAKFAAAAKELGYASWTAYEYHIGGWMYESKPLPVYGRRTAADEALLSFNKRLNPDSCQLLKGLFEIYADGNQLFAPVQAVRVDGNRLHIRSPHFPHGPFEIKVPPLQDTPELWLFKDRHPNETPAGTFVRIPSEVTPDARRGIGTG
jgi:hypothetical protein